MYVYVGSIYVSTAAGRSGFGTGKVRVFPADIKKRSGGIAVTEKKTRGGGRIFYVSLTCPVARALLAGNDN